MSRVDVPLHGKIAKETDEIQNDFIDFQRKISLNDDVQTDMYSYDELQEWAAIFDEDAVKVEGCK